MNDQNPPTETVGPQSPSHFLTYRLSRLHGKLNAQASRILRNAVGITLNQWRMLAFIGGSDRITASELIARTAMDKGLVSRNVNALVNCGLVQRSTPKADQRLQMLSLTPEGRAVFDTAMPVMQTRQANLQKHLSADDIATFRRVLDLLEEAAAEPGF